MLYLSKSKYCRLWQCAKQLWLDINYPELQTEDPSREDRMITGNEVGDLAMGLFGDFTEVTAHKEDGRLDLAHMIAHTQDLFPKIKDLPPEEQTIARKNLLQYCKLDTYAMVKVWEELVRVCNHT